VDVQDEFVSKGLAGIDQRTEKFFVARRVGSIYTGGAGKKGIYDFYKEVLSEW